MTTTFKSRVRPFILALASAAAMFVGCQAKDTNVADLRRRGDHYLLNGQYTEAANNYAEYIEKKPGEPDVRANYGRALLAIGKNAEAVEHLQVAYGQRPDDDGILDALCEAMLKTGQHDSLFKLLKTNTIDRGGGARVTDHLRLGKYALAMGDSDTAMLGYTTAARLDRGQTVAPQIGLYDYYMAIGDKPNAERRLRMAYYISPVNAEVQTRIAQFRPVVGPTFGMVPAER